MAQAMTAQAADNAQRRADKAARELHQREREATLDQNRGLTNFRRQDPPKFMGGTDPDKADLWIQEIEKIFGVLQTAEGAKVGLTTYLLLGDAEYWWRGARGIMEANHEEVDERYMCKRFVNGLRADIEDYVRPLGITRFQALVEKATEVEMMKNKRMNRVGTGGLMRSRSQNNHETEILQQRKPYQLPEGRGFTPGSYKPMIAATPGAGSQSAHPEVTCFRCGKNGHYANSCQNQGPRCFNCNQPGHMAVECKAPMAEPTVNIVKGKRTAAKGRVYVMDSEEADGAETKTDLWLIVSRAKLF
ncbi:uncharacterized protein LOC130737734 [Lotus japonicus]|uniref:uncharacterized protein LOC130737734 n=1 Tax=Lotus japonicus TaxID=34305 RepID=UPI0025844272|nr:uncharacterized protein LOC130737734 [Lotus japonicus]